MSPRFGSRGDGGASSGSRSASEREAARLERERRRSQREGRETPPAVPSAEPVADLDLDHHHDDLESALPVEPESASALPAAFEPLAAPDPEPWIDPEPSLPDPEPFHAPEPVPTPSPILPDEPPAGVRRVPAPTVRDLPQVAGVRDRPRSRRGVPRSRRGPRRIVGLLLLAVLIALGWFAVRLFEPFHGDGTGVVRVVIAPGSSAGRIGSVLADHDVVASGPLFNLRARLAGRRGQLRAGTFVLKHDMSYGAAIAALTRNGEAPPVVRITIPEGRSIDETAAEVRDAGLTGSYVAAAHRNPREVDQLKALHAPRGIVTLEGLLFPATYELRPGASASRLVNEQIRAFRRAFAPSRASSACPGQHLTGYDVVIIASMIEREAQVARDRRLIAAVICNRLRQGMPLGIDATLRYRLRNWSRPLRRSELALDSAYNTGRHTGLPPTPIGAPGKASLDAALTPAHSDVVFYVVRPCGNGAHAFSSTYAQFQRDVAAYDRKRAALGGRDPSHC